MALVGTKKPPQGGFFVSGVEIICLVVYPNGGKRKMFMAAAVDYLAPRRDLAAETESGRREITDYLNRLVMPPPSQNIRVFTTPSRSDPGKAYRIHVLGDSVFKCTCPGFEFRRTCRHATEVQSHLDQYSEEVSQRRRL